MANLSIKLLIIMGLFSFLSKAQSKEAISIHNLEYTSITGETVSMKDFEGKHVLIVNVASECGFTPQYEGLETLSEQYKDQLVVIGFPCDQFGGQEPGGSEEIQNFCKLRYGVNFPLGEKIEVKGAKQHPIYEWLTDKKLNGKKSSSVKWNFQKYLIDPEGNLVDYYYSITKPLSEKITKNFK
jgi:glutathione peroxidase